MYTYIRVKFEDSSARHANLELKYPSLSSDFNQNWKVSHILVELPKENFREQPFCSSISFLRVERHTESAKLTDAPKRVRGKKAVCLLGSLHLTRPSSSSLYL